MTRHSRPAHSILAVLAIASALALTGCAPITTQPGVAKTPNVTEKPFDGTRTAKEVFTDFRETIADTIQHSGTTFPGWDPEKTAGYSTESCGIKTREDGSRYAVEGQGGPIGDPKAAIEAMKSHWDVEGYKIGNIFDESETTSGKGVEINATTPSGVFVQFTASTHGSFVNVKSDCTLDPLAKDTTTDTIPLGKAGTAAPGSSGS